MAIDKALLDQLLAGREPQNLFAKGGLIDDLKKAFSEHMLAVHLQYSTDSDCISSRPQADLSLAVFVWLVTSALVVFGIPSVNARIGSLQSMAGVKRALHHPERPRRQRQAARLMAVSSHGAVTAPPYSTRLFTTCTCSAAAIKSTADRLTFCAVTHNLSFNQT